LSDAEGLKGVLDLLFLPGQDFLASSDYQGLVYLWNLKALKPAAIISARIGSVYCLTAFTAPADDGRSNRTILAAGGTDCRVLFWDVTNPTQPNRIGATTAGHQGYVLTLASSPDGQSLASAGLDGTILLWDVANGRVLGPLLGPSTVAGGLAFAGSGKRLI